MKLLKIKKVIEKGQLIIVPEDELTEEGIYIEILCEDKKGRRKYPNIYFCSAFHAFISEGRTLLYRKIRLVPIWRLKKTKLNNVESSLL
jgi:hypothetical protein